MMRDVHLQPAMRAAIVLLASLAGSCATPQEGGLVQSDCYYNMPWRPVYDRAEAYVKRCFAGNSRFTIQTQPGEYVARVVLQEGGREVLVTQVKSGSRTCTTELEVRAVDAEWARRIPALQAAGRGEQPPC